MKTIVLPELLERHFNEIINTVKNSKKLSDKQKNAISEINNYDLVTFAFMIACTKTIIKNDRI